jgi:hypothetical protein
MCLAVDSCASVFFDESYRLTSPGLCAMVEKQIDIIAQAAFSAHFCPAIRV